MIKDKVTVTIKTGAGGRGSLAMMLDKVFGGDGGRGGDIYLQGDENIFDLSFYDYGHKYKTDNCLLYTSPSPRDRQKSRMPSSA